MNYDVANRNVNEKKRHKEVWYTQGGTFTTFAKTTITNLKFPQFTTRRNFEAEFHLFERKKKSNYDAILGRDLMTKLGIVLDYKKDCFAWGGIEIPMLPMGHLTSTNIKKFRKEPEQNYKIIKDAAYKQPDLNDVAAAQTHLKESQRSILLHILHKHKAIFKAKRGHWAGQDVDIELKADATPYHARLTVFLKLTRSHPGKRLKD